MRQYDNESKEDVVNLLTSGYIQFNLTANSERILYIKYKTGDIIIDNPSTKMEMQILEILENLGFPMDEIGTYFYKNLIINILKMLTEDLTNKDVVESELESPYSQLYFDVARNDLDVGIKSFRECVNYALAKINIENANPEVFEAIVQKMENAISNNQLPLVIAEYSRQFYLGKTRVRASLENFDSEDDAN